MLGNINQFLPDGVQKNPATVPHSGDRGAGEDFETVLLATHMHDEDLADVPTPRGEVKRPDLPDAKVENSGTVIGPDVSDAGPQTDCAAPDPEGAFRPIPHSTDEGRNADPAALTLIADPKSAGVGSDSLGPAPGSRDASALGFPNNNAFHRKIPISAETSPLVPDETRPETPNSGMPQVGSSDVQNVRNSPRTQDAITQLHKKPDLSPGNEFRQNNVPGKGVLKQMHTPVSLPMLDGSKAPLATFDETPYSPSEDQLKRASFTHQKLSSALTTHQFSDLANNVAIDAQNVKRSGVSDTEIVSIPPQSLERKSPANGVEVPENVVPSRRDTEVKTRQPFSAISSNSQSDAEAKRTYPPKLPQIGDVLKTSNEMGAGPSGRAQMAASALNISSAPSKDPQNMGNLPVSSGQVDADQEGTLPRWNAPSEFNPVVGTDRRAVVQPNISTSATILRSLDDVGHAPQRPVDMASKSESAMERSATTGSGSNILHSPETPANGIQAAFGEVAKAGLFGNNPPSSGGTGLPDLAASTGKFLELRHLTHSPRGYDPDRGDRRQENGQIRTIRRGDSPRLSAQSETVTSRIGNGILAVPLGAAPQDVSFHKTSEKTVAWTERDLEFAAATPAEVRTAAGSQGAAQNMAGTGHHTASVIRQMIEISGQLRDGPVEVSLNPEELGKVRMQIVSSDQGVTMQITAERGETLDMLRRHIDQLHRELLAMGYENPRFSFDREGGRDQQRAHSDADVEQTAAAQATTPNPNGPRQSRAGGLDIRI